MVLTFTVLCTREYYGCPPAKTAKMMINYFKFLCSIRKYRRKLLICECQVFGFILRVENSAFCHVRAFHYIWYVSNAFLAFQSLLYKFSDYLSVILNTWCGGQGNILQR